MPINYIKKNDTAYTFTDTLLVDGSAYDLTGASILFLMRKGSETFSDTAAAVSPTAGTVQYVLGAGFPTSVGKWRQEWQVTKAGKVLTFPSDSYNEISIIEDLN